jgi:hypothetical protein
VSAASTRQLIATKLIPQGLVAKADGAMEVVPLRERSMLSTSYRKFIPRLIT